MDNQLAKECIEIGVSKMSERDKKICKMLMQGETQNDIATNVGISQPQVCRIRERIIKNTRKAMEEHCV